MTFSYKKTLNCYFQHTIQGIDNDKSTSRMNLRCPDTVSAACTYGRIQCNPSSFIQTLLSVPQFQRFNIRLSLNIRTCPGIFQSSPSVRGLYRRSGITPCPEDMRLQRYLFLLNMQNFHLTMARDDDAAKAKKMKNCISLQVLIIHMPDIRHELGNRVYCR